MYLSIGEFKSLDNNFHLWITLTDFALKEDYKRLQSIGDKLAEIDSLIDWKPFCIIFGPYILREQHYIDLKQM